MTKKERTIDEIAKIEQLIVQKYGKETLINVKANWTDEKEKDYLNQLKELYQKEKQSYQDNSAKSKIGDFLVISKLINENNRVCLKCKHYSWKSIDDVYMIKYGCCFKCYVQYIEGRENKL